jgi:type IV pilus assembly protein PilP
MSMEIRRMTSQSRGARTLACAALAVLFALSASAQSAPPSAIPAEKVPPGADPKAAPATAAAAPLPSPAYTYNPEGRRDPFLSLIGRGDDVKGGVRPAGVTGLLISEVSIKGIVRDRGAFAAMIQGPDNKTFIVKAGDRLMDGTVKSVVQDGVVFSQDVNDPLSLIKQKEIRKTLRTIEGGRG